MLCTVRISFFQFVVFCFVVRHVKKLILIPRDLPLISVVIISTTRISVAEEDKRPAPDSEGKKRKKAKGPLQKPTASGGRRSRRRKSEVSASSPSDSHSDSEYEESAEEDYTYHYDGDACEALDCTRPVSDKVSWVRIHFVILSPPLWHFRLEKIVPKPHTHMTLFTFFFRCNATTVTDGITRVASGAALKWWRRTIHSFTVAANKDTCISGHCRSERIVTEEILSACEWTTDAVDW